MRLIADRILIEPLPTNDKTTGGIIIPDSAKEKQTKGIVRAIGESKMYEDDVPLSPGDIVIYEANAGIEHEDGGVMCRLMKKGNVIAKTN